MKQLIKLRFKKWWYYLRPGFWRFLTQANKAINTKENLAVTDAEYTTRITNLLVYGTTHPEITPRPDLEIKLPPDAYQMLWQELNDIITKS